MNRENKLEAESAWMRTVQEQTHRFKSVLMRTGVQGRVSNGIKIYQHSLPALHCRVVMRNSPVLGCEPTPFFMWANWKSFAMAGGMQCSISTTVSATT